MLEGLSEIEAVGEFSCSRLREEDIELKTETVILASTDEEEVMERVRSAIVNEVDSDKETEEV